MKVGERIKFVKKEWYIVDVVKYNDVEYYYISEDLSSKIGDFENVKNYKGDWAIEFIYRLEDGKYRNVSDDELFSNLLNRVGIKSILLDRKNT